MKDDTYTWRGLRFAELSGQPPMWRTTLPNGDTIDVWHLDPAWHADYTTARIGCELSDGWVGSGATRGRALAALVRAVRETTRAFERDVARARLVIQALTARSKR